LATARILPSYWDIFQLSTFVTIYYFAVKSMPAPIDIFPHFLMFVIVGTVIGLPSGVIMGWLHLKRMVRTAH